MNNMPEAVAAAVNAVMGNVGYIQKKGENKFHNYKFAAVGDLLAKVQPAMAEAGLIIIQDELAHELIADNAVMTATYAFRLMHKSGAEWDGQARHTGMAAARNTKGGFDDKALNKCHTAARKYFLMALFQIPSGDLPDPDEDGDTPQPKQKVQATKAPETQPVSERDELVAWAETVSQGLTSIRTIEKLNKWEGDRLDKFDKLESLEPETYRILWDKVKAHRKALEISELNAP